MKRFLLFLISLASLLVLPGCLQNETTIRLNKDGSGQLVEETYLGAQMLAMLGQFATLGGEGAADPLADMFSEAKAKERVTSLGEGVTFEKAEVIEKDGKKGGRITYRFEDINKLKVAPGEGLGDGVGNMAPTPDQAEEAKAEPVTFAYKDGKLTIKMPQPKKTDEEKPEMPKETNMPGMEEMMKTMMADMEISFRIVCESGIAETNATHRDGNTITLSEMKMGELLKQNGAFEKFTKADQNDPAAMMEALKDVKGVKFEPKQEVTVTLK